MIKTTKEWQSTSMLNKIIERGILCIEITTNDAFFAKVGDGRRSYKNLPYLFQSSFDQLTNVDTSLMELIQNGLGERYTKEEVDAIEHQLMELIQNIDLSNYVTNEVLHEYTQSFTPEEKEKLASLENADLSGLDARVSALEEIDHSLYATEEYVDEKIENLDITVDLSDYATITYVDEKIAAIDIPSIDLSMYATKSWVSTQIANIPGMDLTGYATERYVDDAIAAIPPFIETEYLNGTDIEIVDNGDGTKTVNYVGEDDDTTYDFHGKNGINVTELSDYTSYLNFDNSSYDWNPDSGELTVKNRDARSWTVITPSKELPPGIYELTRTNTTGTLQILHYPFDPSYDYNSDDDEEKPESEKKTKHISEGESTLTFTLSEDTRILIKSNYSTSNVFPLTNYLHLEKISSDLKEYEIGLLPATHSTLGGVIIGEGINLDQDGVISVDTSDAPQYTAGEGISIKDTPTKTISIEQTEFVRGNINNDGSDDDITLYLRTNDFNIIIEPTYESITLNTKVLEQDESYIWKLFFYEENGTFISCTSDFHFDTEQVPIPHNACYLKIVMKRADDTIDNFYEEIEMCNIILSGEKIREISLKPATSETLGGIKVGDNLSIDENGVLSAHDDYDDSEVIRRLDQIEEDYVIEPDHLILNVVE